MYFHTGGEKSKHRSLALLLSAFSRTTHPAKGSLQLLPVKIDFLSARGDMGLLVWSLVCVLQNKLGRSVPALCLFEWTARNGPWPSGSTTARHPRSVLAVPRPLADGCGDTVQKSLSSKLLRPRGDLSCQLRPAPPPPPSPSLIRSLRERPLSATPIHVRRLIPTKVQNTKTTNRSTNPHMREGRQASGQVRGMLRHLGKL